MSQFNFFDKDWLEYQPLFTNALSPKLKVNLPIEFFQSLKFDKESLKQYRIEAARKCSESLGPNPALCISGGVDSQAMVYAFLEANIKFSAYTFVFKNDLNNFDVDVARSWAKIHCVDLIEIPFDVITFLTRSNWDVGIKYESKSPHFNAHYEFCNILKNLGHTGVCFGGITPFRSRSPWGVNYVRNVMNYIKYSVDSNFYVQGNFLSFYPELAWAVAILTPMIDIDVSYAPDNGLFRSRSYAIRYANKILAYHKANFDIIESQKYSGFEKVKQHYEKLSNDGWEFEKRFRQPLEKEILHPNQIVNFQFDPGVEEYLNSLCSKY